MATVKKYRCGNCGAWCTLTDAGKLSSHLRSQRYPGTTAKCGGSGRMPAPAGPQAPLYIESEE